MKEGFRVKYFDEERDRKRAKKLVKKKQSLIGNPIARFNLNLDGSNSDWSPCGEQLLSVMLPIPSDKLINDLNSPEKVADPKTRQRFNMLKLNWESFGAEKTILVFEPPYNNAIERGATNYRGEELARQIGAPTLLIDHPQMGNSDRLTEEQKQNLEQFGYAKVAAAKLRVLKELRVKKINLVGQSMGGWSAVWIAALARNYDIIVENLIIIDPPAVEMFSPNELRKRELKEGSFLGLYQNTPYDAKMRRKSGQSNFWIRRKFDDLRWLLSTLKNDPHGVYVKAMGNPKLGDILSIALSQQSDLHLKFVYGSLSLISPKDANKKGIVKLKHSFPGRVSQAVFPGEPHAVMESAKRFAALTKSVIEAREGR